MEGAGGWSVGFTDALVHAGGKTARGAELVRNMFACLIAQARELGLVAMAEASAIRMRCWP
jgi:hypothetical protein